MADVKTKQRVQQEAPRTDQPKGAIATVMQPRLEYVEGLDKYYQIDRSIWRTLTDAICPNAKTQSGILLYWQYCKVRGFDPFMRFCHLVPVWDSKLDNGPNEKKGGYREGIWPGIAGVRATAFRTREYAGNDPVIVGPMKTRVFKGQMSKWENRQQVFYDEEIEVTFPEWAQQTVYRLVQGRRVAFTGPQVWWEETYGMLGKSELPNEMWSKRRPRGQIVKCATAAAIREGFPEAIGGDMVYEELRQVEPRREDIPPRPTAEQIEHKLKEDRPDEIRRKLEEAAREQAERDQEAAVAAQRTARAARTPQDAKEPARDPETPEDEETSPGEDGGGDPDQAFVLVDYNGHIMPLPASGGYSGPDPALYVEALCRLLRRSASADAAKTIYEHNKGDIARLPPELLLQVSQEMQKKP